MLLFARSILILDRAALQYLESWITHAFLFFLGFLSSFVLACSHLFSLVIVGRECNIRGIIHRLSVGRLHHHCLHVEVRDAWCRYPAVFWIDIFTRFDSAESYSLGRFYAFYIQTFPRDNRQLLSPCWSMLWDGVYRQTVVVVVVFALARRHPRHQEVVFDWVLRMTISLRFHRWLQLITKFFNWTNLSVGLFDYGRVSSRLDLVVQIL